MGINREYGYIRVSTQKQNEDQLAAMADFGIGTDMLFTDMQSDTNAVNTEYQKMIKKLKSGDTVVIRSIDALGHNYKEIQEQLRVITNDKKAAIVVLDMPDLDTRSDRSINGTQLSELVLELLSHMAKIERSFMHRRQAEGISAAKKRGVKFGQPLRQRPEGFNEIIESWKRGEISGREAARRLDIPHSTFREWVNRDSK